MTSKTVSGAEYQSSQTSAQPSALADPLNAFTPWQTSLAPLSDDQALKRITRTMQGVIKGSMRDLRSPLFNPEVPREVIMTEWYRHLDSLDLPEEVKIQEDEWKAKAGPKSGMKPWDECSSVYTAYFEPTPSKVDLDALRECAEHVISTTGLSAVRRRLRPLPIEAAAKLLPATTNWGLPTARAGVKYKYVKEERTSKRKGKYTTIVPKLIYDDRPIFVAMAQQMHDDLNHPGWAQGNLPFRRTDMHGPSVEDCTQRAVWGQPHAVSILDKTYADVVTRYIQENELPGFESIISEQLLDQAMQKGLQEAEASSKILVGEDFSGWDKTICAPLIDVGFGMIGDLFRDEDRPVIEKLRDYFKTSGMLSPDGDLVGRDEHVSSGSGFTLLMNCIMHLLVRDYGELRSKGVHYDRFITVKGDDGCSIYDSAEDFENILNNVYVAELGLKGNVEKNWIRRGSTSFAKQVYLLGHPKGFPPSVRTVASAIGYEHITPEGWTRADDSIRWIAQAGYYLGTPLAGPLVRFLIAGDTEYRLGANLTRGFRDLIALAGGDVQVRRKLGITQYQFAYRDFDPSKVPAVYNLILDEYQRGLWKDIQVGKEVKGNG